MKYRYICDNCEDYEFLDEIIPDYWHCECGGHMHLVKYDNFVKVKDYCQRCVNSNTDSCVLCLRNKL